MTYEEFREYCVCTAIGVNHRMSRLTAENLVDWVFPKEYKDKYEERLAASDEFLKYTTRVLGG